MTSSAKPSHHHHRSRLDRTQQNDKKTKLRWWTDYADRKNDDEAGEHVADSLLYDRRHLPRTAPAPECVVRIQKEVVQRDQEDALERLKNSLVTAFKASSTSPEYITEEEFVNCMLDVDKRAPWDHYDKYLKKTYESLKTSQQGIKFQDYTEMIERAFGVRVTEEMREYLHEKLGDFIDLTLLLILAGNLTNLLPMLSN